MCTVIGNEVNCHYDATADHTQIVSHSLMLDPCSDFEWDRISFLYSSGMIPCCMDENKVDNIPMFTCC